jgi:hypothetical protein
VIEWLEQSNALHQRVQAFIHAPESGNDSFDSLALAIAEYQAQTIPAFARLVRARGAKLDCVASIPAVPVEAFRLTRVAAHPADLDEARFLTSGTTSASRGQHFMRRTDSYRLAAVTWGRRALIPSDADGATVVCLAPRPNTPHGSSLAFMMQAFLDHFDPDCHDEIGPRWLTSEAGVDVLGLRRVLELALLKRRPILVLATSLALVYLLDALDGQRLPSNGCTIVMQTGGFKGKTRQIRPDDLKREVSSAFAIDESRIIGEYGMTELSSQLYEGRLAGAGLCTPPGWYIPPPWLKVDSVDPNTFVSLPDGEVGLASFTDLANVDSALRILTEDCITCRGREIQLLGRAAAADARGCSLSDEELIGPI